MHELGVVLEMLKHVEDIVQENHLVKIEKIILQIGEISGVVPRYIEDCYAMAVLGTMMEKTFLEIEILPANGMCLRCQHVFSLLENHSKCPHCQSPIFDILSGRDFVIKEIVAC